MPILTATDLHKSYQPSGQAPTVVLRGVTVSIDEGEFVAIVGPSGAGKSTLLHILASLDEPSTGTVTLNTDGTPVQYTACSTSEIAAIRNSNIGMVFQFHHLLPEFSALENVMMPALIAGQTQTEARQVALELLSRVGVDHRSENMPSELSGGEQQRVAIARALINNPRILFADEPTGNLDTANAQVVSELIVDLQKSIGITCVVATHSMELANKAHRIIRMQDGACFEQGVE